MVSHLFFTFPPPLSTACEWVEHQSQISPRQTKLAPPLRCVCSPIPHPTPTSVFTVSQSAQSFESVNVGHSVISLRRCLWKNLLYFMVACDLLKLSIMKLNFCSGTRVEVNNKCSGWQLNSTKGVTWLVCNVIGRLALNSWFSQIISISVCHSKWIRRE